MKSHADLWPEITSFENLYAAFRRARAGKHGRGDVAGFECDLDRNLLTLHAVYCSGEGNVPKRRIRGQSGGKVNRHVAPRRVKQIDLPELDRYVSLALRDALPRKLESDGGAWYADLPGFPGVWARGASARECLDGLEEILREWLSLKLADGDRDIPVVDEIALTVLTSRR